MHAHTLNSHYCNTRESINVECGNFFQKWKNIFGCTCIHVRIEPTTYCVEVKYTVCYYAPYVRLWV